MQYLISNLNQQHEKSLFDCGVPALNGWLQHTASQHQAKKLSQTFVLTVPEQPGRVLAYYALNIRGLVQKETLPHTLSSRLPLSAPALAIGRLAVDLSAQKRQYGEAMLVHAMRNAKSAAEIVGGTFLFVDAISADVAGFYARYGFTPLPDSPLTLVIPIKGIP
jgi:predicted GNAT family N-acyltransferase